LKNQKLQIVNKIRAPKFTLMGTWKQIAA
jgi:hypothetical protein